MVFSYMYNDLGAHENWILRNILNACALSAFSLGAFEVACGRGTIINTTVYAWVAILAGVIFSTIQLQDLPDIEGDEARGRKTMVVLGDTFVRWSICIPTMFWSFYCPFFWNLRFLSYVPSLLLGSIIVGRLLTKRYAEADGVTWKIWCFWLGSLYLLPLFESGNARLRA
jgi:4-hydroxybenzoate polyprenyltransferase